jgi:aspartate aminotransferase
MTRLADFVPTALADAGARALTDNARGMTGSLILGIAAEVRALQGRGVPVCNLTVGDFDARQFPVPRALRDATIAAYDGFQTNYPPSEGIPELRKAIVEWYGRHLGIEISPDWVVVAGGARPVMYATYRLFLERGDTLVFAVPSWNNGYYGQLTDAKMVPVRTRAEDNFFPTADTLAPLLRDAQLFTLNSPLNPTGTVIAPERLAEIARVVVAENRRRVGEGRRPLMWMWDQVYWQLTFGAARHAHPCALVPEVSPWVVTIDAISKCWAATGLRVGWAVLPPRLCERMKTILQHVGAWAPRPEQAATAAFLADEPAQAAFSKEFRGGLEERLGILDEGLTRLGVEHLVPQGAIYLSVRFDLFGRPGVDGTPMRTNEDIRKWLLDKAGVAVVPFQAFDVDADEGWFRMSVGAVSSQQLREALERLGGALRG